MTAQFRSYARRSHIVGDIPDYALSDARLDHDRIGWARRLRSRDPAAYEYDPSEVYAALDRRLPFVLRHADWHPNSSFLVLQVSSEHGEEIETDIFQWRGTRLEPLIRSSLREDHGDDIDPDWDWDKLVRRSNAWRAFPPIEASVVNPAIAARTAAAHPAFALGEAHFYTFEGVMIWDGARSDRRLSTNDLGMDELGFFVHHDYRYGLRPLPANWVELAKGVDLELAFSASVSVAEVHRILDETAKSIDIAAVDSV